MPINPVISSSNNFDLILERKRNSAENIYSTKAEEIAVGRKLFYDSQFSDNKITDRLARELQVLGLGASEGFVEQVKYSAKHPLSMAESLATGGGFMLAMRGPSWLRLPASGIGLIGGIFSAKIALEQIGQAVPAIADTWASNKNLASNKMIVASSLGPMAFEATVAFTSGALASKASTLLSNRKFSSGLSDFAYRKPSTDIQLTFHRKKLSDEAKQADIEAASLPGNDIFPPRETFDSLPIPGIYAKNGIWQPKPTLAGYSEAQVKAATSHLPNQYILGKSQTVDDFVKRLHPITEDWQMNNSEMLFKLANENENLAKSAQQRGYVEQVSTEVIDLVGSKLPAWLADDVAKKPSRLRDFLLSESATILGVTEAPAKAQVVSKLIETRSNYAQSHKDTSLVIELRRQQVQKFADQFVRDCGLPEIEIRATEKTGSYGSFLNGKINLQRDLLTGTDNTSLAGTLYHELLHHEQFSLMIRRLADVLNIDMQPKKIERELLLQKYSSELSRSNLPESYLYNVLAARKGQPLNQQQSEASDILLSTSAKTMLTKDSQYKLSGDLYRKLTSLLNKLESESGEKIAAGIERKAEDKLNLLKTLDIFGEISPPKVSANLKSHDNTRTDLINGITQWQKDINVWRQKDFTAYRGRKLEWDAWLLTSIVESAMEAKKVAS